MSDFGLSVMEKGTLLPDFALSMTNKGTSKADFALSVTKNALFISGKGTFIPDIGFSADKFVRSATRMIYF